MSDIKQLFKAPSSSESTDEKVEGKRSERKQKKGDVSGSKQKRSCCKKAGRSLTDEKYEAIFTAVLSQPAEDSEGSEDPESGAEEQNVPAIVNQNEDFDHNIDAFRSARVPNEVTSPVSDAEDELLKSPPSPVKKKFVHKESAKRKQLSYPTKEKKKVLENLPICHKKIQSEIKTLKDKLLHLQSQRIMNNSGTWVQCCSKECGKWRYLEEVKEPFLISSYWYCYMNRDPEQNSCDKPEPDYSEGEFVFNNKFTAGSVVWAKLYGYPWWPAMVDDNPELGEFFYTSDFSDIPTHYNVVFLDEVVSRAWIPKSCIKPFQEKTVNKMLDTKNAKHRKDLERAVKNAITACSLPLKDRLTKYSFVAKYTGKWPTVTESHSLKHKGSGSGNEKMKRNSIKGKKCTSQKQNSNNGSIHEDGLSDAEEILNQLPELDDLESISSFLISADTESEEELLPPFPYTGATAIPKRFAKFKNKATTDGTKKPCLASKECLPSNVKAKNLQPKSQNREKHFVQNSEQKPKSSKNMSHSGQKSVRNESKCISKVNVEQKSKISACQYKADLVAMDVEKDNKTNSETKHIRRTGKEQPDKTSGGSFDKNPNANNRVKDKERKSNNTAKSQKCPLPGKMKDKHKPSFCPPKQAKAISTAKSKQDLQIKEYRPQQNETEEKDTPFSMEKNEIISIPNSDDSSSDDSPSNYSQNSEPF